MFLSLPELDPAEIDVHEDGGADYSTLIPFARCNISGRIVSVRCKLEYMTNTMQTPASSWFHEFSFDILVTDPTGTYEPNETQDRTIARNYLPPDAIGRVMVVVLSSLDRLISRVRPPIVYRVTKTIRPNQKALKKHILITDHLLRRGYKLHQEGKDGFSRHFWLMTLAH